MFELTVDSAFCAAHALAIGAARENIHGHNWKITATIRGDTLDNDGLLCDFHTIQDQLHEVVEPFQNNNLNNLAPFDQLNPSAENVARYIAEELSRRLDTSLAPSARVASVRVTEAEGCAATYFP